MLCFLFIICEYKLYLESEGLTYDNTRVKISPLVPSIILDYQTRNWKKIQDEKNTTISSVNYLRIFNEYTLGVLLGIEIGSNIIITNAFGVNFDSDKHLIDDDYVEFMKKYLSYGTKEKIVGMFHITKNNQDLNDIGVMMAFSQITKKQDAKQKSIILTTSSESLKDTDGSLQLNAFLYFPFKFGETSSNLCIFMDIPVEVIVDDMPASGLDTILLSQNYHDTLSIYWNEANYSNIAALESVKQYIDEVAEGKRELDPKIAKEINNAISKISSITPETIDKILDENHNDLEYIRKLCDLIKEQVAVSQLLTREIK